MRTGRGDPFFPLGLFVPNYDLLNQEPSFSIPSPCNRSSSSICDESTKPFPSKMKMFTVSLQGKQETCSKHGENVCKVRSSFSNALTVLALSVPGLLAAPGFNNVERRGGMLDCFKDLDITAWGLCTANMACNADGSRYWIFPWSQAAALGKCDQCDCPILNQK